MMKKPTQPKAPRKPTKPAMPEKVLKYSEKIYLDLGDGDSITLGGILKLLPEGVSADEAFIQRDDDSYGCYECGGSTEINAYYPKEVENKQYKTQMKAYEKKMVTYNRKLAEFKIKFEEWKTKKDDYIEALRLYDTESTERTIAKLERELRKLKAS